MTRKVRIKRPPERFGKYELIGRTEELVGLEIDVLYRRDGGEFFVTKEAFIRVLRKRFPKRFRLYDEKYDQEARKIDQEGKQGIPKLASPADEYFRLKCPFNFQIPFNIAEEV